MLDSAAMGLRHVLVLAAFFLVQVADGALTYIGVHRFGLGAEGNLLLKTAMGAYGILPALVGAKLLASSCGLLLFAFSVYRVLAAATGLHVVFAVVPWLLALS